jgi:hypothetical protein
MQIQVNKWEIIFYKSEEWDIRINALFQNETIWLSQKQMWELFWVNENNITYHLKEIYSSWEIDEKWTTQIFWVVQKEGNREINRNISFYNLDAIIAVWYRVNSYQAKNWNVTTMQDWINRTKTFFELNNLKILSWKWTISKEKADEKVKDEFEKFRVIQDKNYIWDFDKFVEEVKKKKSI